MQYVVRYEIFCYRANMSSDLYDSYKEAFDRYNQLKKYEGVVNCRIEEFDDEADTKLIFDDENEVPLRV